jgi:hypothetical protein
MTAKMSKQQMKYAGALALHQTLKAERDEKMRAWEKENYKLERNSDEKRVEGYYTALGEIETALGYWPALDALAKAENEMMEWATEKTIHLANKEQAAGIRDMVQKAKTFEMLPSMRAKLIDLAFHLNAR